MHAASPIDQRAEGARPIARPAPFDFRALRGPRIAQRGDLRGDRPVLRTAREVPAVGHADGVLRRGLAIGPRLKNRR